MQTTLDGLPVQRGICFLADIYTGINEWSAGKTTKITVLDFYINMHSVTSKGRTAIVEVDLFKGMVAQWMKGDRWGNVKPMSREEALDQAFEMMA